MKIKIKNKKIISLILYWTIFGITVVILRTAIKYGFDKKMFWDNFNKDIWIGVGTSVIIGVIMNRKTID